MYAAIQQGYANIILYLGDFESRRNTSGSQLEMELENAEMPEEAIQLPRINNPLSYQDTGLPGDNYEILCGGKKENKAKLRWSSKKANHGKKPCHGKKG